jgi:Na+-transporting NADH:ubiquinone oxidoreductase subunit NqrF
MLLKDENILITLILGASKKKVTLTANSFQKEESLMDFLHQQNYPITSSCRGLGICKKCLVNESQLSCQIKLKDCHNKEFKISYL